MNTQQYKDYRASLYDELLDIREQLSKLAPREKELEDLLFAPPIYVAVTGSVPKKRIPPLKKRTAKKTAAKKKVVLKPSATNGTMKKLIDFIKSNPGRSRANIRAYFGSELTDNQVKNLMNLASKHGHIVNHGNKRYPKWYVAGHQA